MELEIVGVEEVYDLDFLNLETTYSKYLEILRKGEADPGVLKKIKKVAELMETEINERKLLENFGDYCEKVIGSLNSNNEAYLQHLQTPYQLPPEVFINTIPLQDFQKLKTPPKENDTNAVQSSKMQRAPSSSLLDYQSSQRNSSFCSTNNAHSFSMGTALAMEETQSSLEVHENKYQRTRQAFSKNREAEIRKMLQNTLVNTIQENTVMAIGRLEDQKRKKRKKKEKTEEKKVPTKISSKYLTQSEKAAKITLPPITVKKQKAPSKETPQKKRERETKQQENTKKLEKKSHIEPANGNVFQIFPSEKASSRDSGEQRLPQIKNGAKEEQIKETIDGPTSQRLNSENEKTEIKKQNIEEKFLGVVGQETHSFQKKSFLVQKNPSITSETRKEKENPLEPENPKEKTKSCKELEEQPSHSNFSNEAGFNEILHRKYCEGLDIISNHNPKYNEPEKKGPESAEDKTNDSDLSNNLLETLRSSVQKKKMCEKKASSAVDILENVKSATPNEKEAPKEDPEIVLKEERKVFSAKNAQKFTKNLNARGEAFSKEHQRGFTQISESLIEEEEEEEDEELETEQSKWKMETCEERLSGVLKKSKNGQVEMSSINQWVEKRLMSEEYEEKQSDQMEINGGLQETGKSLNKFDKDIEQDSFVNKHKKKTKNGPSNAMEIRERKGKEEGGQETKEGMFIPKITFSKNCQVNRNRDNEPLDSEIGSESQQEQMSYKSQPKKSFHSTGNITRPSQGTSLGGSNLQEKTTHKKNIQSANVQTQKPSMGVHTIPEANDKINPRVPEKEKELQKPVKPQLSKTKTAQPAPAKKSEQQNQPNHRSTMAILPSPELVTDYTDLIPTINHLFSGHYRIELGFARANSLYTHGFDLVNAMVETFNLFRSHIELMENEETRMQGNILMTPMDMSPADQFFQNGSDIIYMSAHMLGINLEKYRARRNVFQNRLNMVNHCDTSDPNTWQFFRVVKARSEVYDVVTRSFFRREGWFELAHGMNLRTSWDILWTWSKPQINLSKLIFFQKINHFPENKNLGRKDLLKKNIDHFQHWNSLSPEGFNIIPTTFILPKEYVSFVNEFSKSAEEDPKANIWIMKPAAKSRGRGISLVTDLTDVSYSEPMVIQKYIKNPMLINGHKFDLRIYVLITHIRPLEAFLYKEGFARLSTKKYSIEKDDLKNLAIHLTNYSIQKQIHEERDGFFGKREVISGSKLSLKTLSEVMAKTGVRFKEVWTSIIECVLKSLICTQGQIESNPNSFELFGYDLLIDSNLKCWLIEVNSSPSLARDTLYDDIIKQHLIDDSLDIVAPPKFDRKRLVDVLNRRIQEGQNQKSKLNTGNNSKLQLNKDIGYILHGQEFRKYGQMPTKIGDYEMIAPSPTFQTLYQKLVKPSKQQN